MAGNRGGCLAEAAFAGVEAAQAPTKVRQASSAQNPAEARVLRLMPGINGITASAERKIAVHCRRNVRKERHQPAASKGLGGANWPQPRLSHFPQNATRLAYGPAWSWTLRAILLAPSDRNAGVCARMLPE